GIVVGERFVIELTPSMFPQRHVAGDRFPQRYVAGDSGLIIGHLLLKIPAAANEVRSVLREASMSRSFCKNRVIGVESDDGGDDGLPFLNKRHNTSLVIRY
ncbi:hypothetical protein Tco_1308854, partial [Tanacetum coccineum]